MSAPVRTTRRPVTPTVGIHVGPVAGRERYDWSHTVASAFALRMAVLTALPGEGPASRQMNELTARVPRGKGWETVGVIPTRLGVDEIGRAVDAVWARVEQLGAEWLEIS